MAQIKTGDLVASRYRVEHLLGVGGMATVFAACEIDTDRRVAIKVLNEVLRRHPTIPKRFVQEARAARVLTTPFAVKVEGTGELADGTPYILMEYLDGTDLAAAARQAGGKLPVDRALYLADQIAEALQEAHSRGVLHRDLKPENVFVIPTPVGEMIKVMDFGISKIMAPGEANKITVTGTTVGTPQYMPIEQLRGVKDLDGRVDVYALGVLLFEMLAGLRPFDGFSYEEVIMKVATQTAPSLATYRADLPTPLVDVIMRAMARDRNHRIASMDQLRAELRPFWSGHRPDFTPYVQPPKPISNAPPADSGAPSPSGRGVGMTVPMDDPKQVAAFAAAADAADRAWPTPAPTQVQPPAPAQIQSPAPAKPAPTQIEPTHPDPRARSYPAGLADSSMQLQRPSDPRMVAALSDSQMMVQRSDPRVASTVGYATGRPAPARKRVPTVAIVVGVVVGLGVLVVIVAAAAGAWFYVEAPAPVKAPASAPVSAQPHLPR
ncbi:MAG: protein kinase [Deltaproteobacteria bacterium]|nr:protein kinase [Deltaproteobacteria bacterium]